MDALPLNVSSSVWAGASRSTCLGFIAQLLWRREWKVCGGTFVLRPSPPPCWSAGPELMVGNSKHHRPSGKLWNVLVLCLDESQGQPFITCTTLLKFSVPTKDSCFSSSMAGRQKKSSSTSASPGPDSRQAWASTERRTFVNTNNDKQSFLLFLSYKMSRLFSQDSSSTCRDALLWENTCKQW